MTSRARFRELETLARTAPAELDRVRRAATSAGDWDDAAVALLAGHRAGAALEVEAVEFLAPRTSNIVVAINLLRTLLSRFDVLLRLVASGALGNEREAAALGLAVASLEGRPLPPEVERLRVEVKYRVMEGLADLLRSTALAAIGMPRDSKEWRALEKYAAAPLEDAMTDGVVTRSVGPARATQAPGRNDPCPCGSGLKFKKCHEGQVLPGEAGHQPPPVPSVTTAAAVDDLRIMDLERLPLGPLEDLALIIALRRLSDYARWERAELAIEEMERRTSFESRQADFRLEVLDAMLRVGAKEQALALSKRCRDLPPDVALRLELLEPGPQLAHLEASARRALEVELEGIELAHAALAHVPALGVLIARGVAARGNDVENSTLLHEVHCARELLGLPPEDPADEYAELGEEHARGRRFERILAFSTRKGSETEANQLEALQAEANEARERARELERKLKLTERALDRVPSGETAQRPDETARLRRRIDELKHLVAEGNETRARLRRELAQREAEALSATPLTADVARGEDDETEDAAETIRRPLTPHFTDAAKKALRELPRHVQAASVERVGLLAAARPHAWRGVKQLEVQRGVYSARVGIHHRLLFAMQGDELVVEDVIHRAELEHWLGRRT